MGAINWNVDLPEADVDPLSPCDLTFTWQADPFGRRSLRRIITDMRARPDLKVDVTCGWGLWWRNGRIRITGPYYAMRPATIALRTALENL
jgi:hypothetical protein